MQRLAPILIYITPSQIITTHNCSNFDEFEYTTATSRSGTGQQTNLNIRWPLRDVGQANRGSSSLDPRTFLTYVCSPFAHSGHISIRRNMVHTFTNMSSRQSTATCDPRSISSDVIDLNGTNIHYKEMGEGKHA